MTEEPFLVDTNYHRFSESAEPGVGKEVVRKIIGTQPGSFASVKVKGKSQTRFIKATVLRQVGTKLVK